MKTPSTESPSSDARLDSTATHAAPLQRSGNTEADTVGRPPQTRGSTYQKAGVATLVALPLIATLLFTLNAPLGNAAHTLAQPVAEALGQLSQSPMFWLAVLVGFSAQMIDGALGMAYGISSTTFLMGLGASPAAASGAVHVAEVFTTGLSGASHWRLGNIDRALFNRIVIPGVLGSVAGAYVLTSIDGTAIKPFVSAYLLLLGIHILRKAWVGHSKQQPTNGARVQALAATGGFLDAAGGGGWGPVVTTSLIGSGNTPRTTIGTVNAAEFFVSLAAGGAFLLFGDISHGELIAGLVLGGVFAAPLGAWLTRHLSARVLLWLVGGLITLISTYNLVRALT